MKTSHRILLAALVALIADGPARAAEPDTPLSLEESIALAVVRTPELQAQAAAIQAAQSQSDSAGRLPDPELLLAIENVPVSGADAWSLNSEEMTMRKVGVMQAFPSQRKREAQRSRAAASVSFAQSREREMKLQIAHSVADAWVRIHAAELALSKLRLLEPEIDLQAQAARSALASGRGSSLDALAAQSEKGELGDRVLQMQREIATGRAELAQWIGDDAGRALAAAPSFTQLPAPKEQLLASLHRHAELQVYDAQRALAQSEIDLARADKRADWSAGFAYGDRGSAFSDMVSLEFRVGLPLFGRHRQDPQISARQSDLAQLDAEREAGLRMHTAELTGMLAAWDAAHSRIDLYERERLPLARERSRAALAGFRAGTVNLTDLLASHVAEIEIQRSYADLVRELGQSWAYLRYVDGGQEPR